MAEQSVDDIANTLLVALKKSTVSIDTKLSQFNSLKSVIKHQRIPESAQAATVECIRLSIASQTSSSLVTAGLSAVAHLIKRLAIQGNMNAIFSQRAGLIPALLERLGDAKESYRTSALQSFCDLYPERQAEVEKVIKEGAILGSNPRAKEAGMQWVTKMHEEQGLQFRSFVPTMVDLLEDADGHIRESAKKNLVELFSTASDRAKADLKKQLLQHNVRKSIASFILIQLGIDASELGVSAQPAQSMPRAEPPRKEPVHLADSAPPEIALPPSAETTHIEPLYVESYRQLERIFEDMAPCFEGKETEQNWLLRDKNVLKLRRLTQGNAPTEHYVTFIAGIKTNLDGLLKVANSLRTTMSSNGCQLIQELARTLGPGLDPMVELLLQCFIKMCSATKNIAAQNGNTTCDAIFSHVSYNVRLLQHINAACQDKNAQPRIFASGWLKTILKKHGHGKSHIEHSGGLELTEKSIKKGLADANPKVREGMRGTFWVFAQTWPQKGEEIMSTLDTKSRGLLEKDPGNPNAGAVAGLTSSVGPGSTTNPRAAASSKGSSVRDVIAAQKKAALAKKFPERPNSAMANLSPAKPERTPASRAPSHALNTSARPAQAPASSSRTATKPLISSSSTGQGSLMSAPMRRPKKVETQRPATADPYAHQALLRDETPPAGSPAGSPRPVSKSSTSSIPSSHIKSKSTTATMHAPVSSGQSSRAASPRVSPSKIRPRSIQGTGETQQVSPRASRILSPSHRDGNATLLPEGKTTPRQPFAPFRAKHENDRPGSVHSPLSNTAEEEDNFTLVMPNKSFVPPHQPNEQANAQLSRSPQQSRTPKDGANEMSNLDVDLDNATAVTIENTDGERGNMMVFEDPGLEQPGQMKPEKMVLEELPANEQNVAQGQDAGASSDQRSISPSKRSRPTTPGEPSQDRAEVLKSRRLVASGVERIRTKAIDAHGFRRLQDVAKSTSQSLESQQYVDLVVALLEYLDAPNDSLKVPPSKAQSLKSQALSIVRAVLVMHQRDEGVKAAYPRALCGVVAAKKGCDALHSHLATDLDKTADEIIKHTRSQVTNCIDAVLALAEHEDASGPLPGPRRTISMALNVLSKLLGQQKGRQESPSVKQRLRMGRLAVKFLDNTDPDVRRADTEFCLELRGAFEDGNEGKREFWKVLEGARETQLNLVAYYLAKRGEAT